MSDETSARVIQLVVRNKPRPKVTSLKQFGMRTCIGSGACRRWISMSRSCSGRPMSRLDGDY